MRTRRAGGSRFTPAGAAPTAAMSTPASVSASGPNADSEASKLAFGTTISSISAWPSGRLGEQQCIENDAGGVEGRLAFDFEPQHIVQAVDRGGRHEHPPPQPAAGRQHQPTRQVDDLRAEHGCQRIVGGAGFGQRQVAEVEDLVAALQAQLVAIAFAAQAASGRVPSRAAPASARGNHDTSEARHHDSSPPAPSPSLAP